MTVTRSSRAGATPPPSCGMCARDVACRRSQGTSPTSTPSLSSPTSRPLAPAQTMPRVASLTFAQIKSCSYTGTLNPHAGILHHFDVIVLYLECGFIPTFKLITQINIATSQSSAALPLWPSRNRGAYYWLVTTISTVMYGTRSRVIEPAF